MFCGMGVPIEKFPTFVMFYEGVTIANFWIYSLFSPPVGFYEGRHHLLCFGKGVTIANFLVNSSFSEGRHYREFSDLFFVFATCGVLGRALLSQIFRLLLCFTKGVTIANFLIHCWFSEGHHYREFLDLFFVFATRGVSDVGNLRKRVRPRKHSPTQRGRLRRQPSAMGPSLRRWRSTIDSSIYSNTSAHHHKLIDISDV